jgi:hypothetical protein
MQQMMTIIIIAPIGKPKTRRVKRNTKYINIDLGEDLNSFGGKKNYKNKIINLHNKTNDNLNKMIKNDNNNNRFYTFSDNKNNRSAIDRITTPASSIPSMYNSVECERDILKLESDLFNLQKERDWVNDEYLKYPEYPKKRDEINAKRNIEIKLEEMNKEINLQKLKIRELKEQK